MTPMNKTKRTLINWTNKENQKLVELYELYPNNWDLISKGMGYRNKS